MNKYSKFNDINAVLEKAKSTLDTIEIKYNESLHDQNISDELLVEIKDYLGNLRSALDYIWNKISSGYFPIANSSTDFLAKTSNIDQKYSNIIQPHQDYDINSWIRCFSLFRNKNTHITLVPQKRTETQRIKSTHTGGGSVSWDPNSVRFDSGVYINGAPVNPSTQMPINTPDTTITKEIWVDFIFDGSSISSDFPQNISALPFLKKCFENVPKIISDIENIMEQ